MKTAFARPFASEHMSAPGFRVPALACDTHSHVISSDLAAYPFIESRSYTPIPATEAQYLAMLDRLKCDRGVLIQVSVHGTDNRLMLETLKRYPERLRGVVVVEPDIDDSVLDAMHEAGVRGVRINTMLKGGVGYEHLEALARKIKRLGWHIQFLSDARDIPAMYAQLRDIQVPCVLDHMGNIAASSDPDSDEVRAVTQLVRDHGWWVKLSGAYRMGLPCSRLEETTSIARAIFDACPERMLWGSDWPHVNVSEMPDTGRLLGLLATWIPDDASREQILVHNPARLYGFPDHAAGQRRWTAM